MGLRRISLVLYILFIFYLQQKISPVSSRPSSVVATSHESRPLNASKQDDVGFEGKARELAVVIKKGRGGGGGARGGGRGGGRRGRVVPVHAGGGSHRSSGSRNLGGPVWAVGWLGLSVLAGLFLV